MPEESVVVYIENNRVANKSVIKDSLPSVVKSYVKNLVDQWNPEESDFIVLKVVQTVSLSYR